MKIAVAGILHETNTFAPGRTSLEDFHGEWVRGLEVFTERYEGTRTSMGGVLSAAKAQGVELAVGLYAAATPSGMVAKDAAEELLEAVVQSIDSEIDGLLIIMHGAMVAEGYPDMEGELLRRIRQRRGSSLPLAMTLDLHANISPLMVELADLIVGYDTYPHIDMFERAEEAMALLIQTVQGSVCPVNDLSRPRMLVVPQGMLTDEGAMKELMDEAFAMEQQPGVLNVTVAGGFPYSDVADAGMSFVVTTDGNPVLAKELADRLAQMAWERKEQFTVSFCGPEEAVAKAVSIEEGPVILTEGSDNVGGGAPADATHLLALLTDPPVKTLVVIRDAEVALEAHRLGTGAGLEARIGGKSDELHGQPVPIKGKVRLLFDGVYHHVGPYMTGQRADMGKTAVIECGRLTVVVTEKRTAPWDLGHVRSVGLWPEDYHILVVKSAIAWQAAFGRFAKAVIHVETPGCCTSNLKHLPYTQLERPIDPLDVI